MPIPTDPTSEHDMAAILFSEHLRHYMLTSPYYLSDVSSSKEPSILPHHRHPASLMPLIEIDRYSDKYVAHLRAQDKRGKIHAIVTDLSFFPEELHSAYNHEMAQRLHSRLKTQPKKATFLDTLAQLRELERADGAAENGGGDEGEGGGGGGGGRGGDEDDEEEDEDEAVYEEEELEDETDYNVSYFDNGEDGGDYDDGDEGPYY